VWLYLRDKNIYLAGVHDFMAEFKPDFTDDEIDLRELCAALWRGKWLIFRLWLLFQWCWLLSIKGKRALRLSCCVDLSPYLLDPISGRFGAQGSPCTAGLESLKAPNRWSHSRAPRRSDMSTEN